MTWHVEPKTLRAYATGTVDDARAYSVEAHLLECDVCRGALRPQVDTEDLESLWVEIVERTVFAPSGRMERFLLRLGVSDHLARLLTATPSLHASWLAGIALVLAFAVIAAYVNDQGFVMFLISAPLLPLAGIAVAYGPGVDPTYEVGLVAPMRSFRLLLIRATAVLATSGAMALVAGIVLPKPAWVLVAWLLPAMGLALTSLALSTWISPLRAAALLATVWVTACGMGVAYAARTPATIEGVFGGVTQVGLAIVAVAAGMLLIERRETFDGGGRR